MKDMTGLVNGRVRLYLSLLFLVYVAGCSVVGWTVPVDNRILFAGQDSAQGIFRHGDLTVNYTYDLRATEMKLKGSVRLRGGFDSLDVLMQFIDAEGTVLKQKIVYSSGYRVARSWDIDRSFQTLLDVPPDAAGISFTYMSQPRSGNR